MAATEPFGNAIEINEENAPKGWAAVAALGRTLPKKTTAQAAPRTSGRSQQAMYQPIDEIPGSLPGDR
jgi:hypothetical protein